MKWNMTWNVLLLVVALYLLIMAAGKELARPLGMADSLAGKVAPKVGVDEAVLRTEIKDTLKGWMGNALVVEAVPWILMLLLLASRCVAEWRRDKRQERSQRSLGVPIET